MIKKLFTERFNDVIILIVIIIFAFVVRVAWLNTIPANISGDEITNLSDAYKILFSNNSYLLSFMGDGSVAGINFYWMALWIKIFGLEHTVFSLRLSIVILSCLSLIPFYLILRSKTSTYIAGIFTFILSTNLVFINFSRTAWVNMGIIFTGLWMLFLLEKAESKNSKLWYSLAGVFAGLTLYGYHYGRILVAGILIYLLLSIVKKRNRSKFYIHNILLFFVITLVTILPFLLNIFLTNREAVLRRPLATFVFTQEKIEKNGFANVLISQTTNTIRGFALLDKQVMARGVENARYSPPNKSIAGVIIQVIFIIGLFYLLASREKIPHWWIIFITTLLVQVVSDTPPNFSRGIFYIPFIFVVCAIFTYRMMNHIKFPKTKRYVTISITVFTVIVCTSNIYTYFSWSQSQVAITARQPAINYDEFHVWQNYQIDLIKKGYPPVTNYEWYEIRKKQ